MNKNGFIDLYYKRKQMVQRSEVKNFGMRAIRINREEDEIITRGFDTQILTLPS